MATPRPAATPPCDSDPPCTATVEALWGMGTGPEDPDVLVGAEGSYDVDMATLMATVIAIGVVLLLIHACFRLGLCCKHLACKGKPIQKKCCPCVEKKCCKRQALILKIALALVLVGVVLSLLSYTAGSARIGAAVEDVADAMDQLADFLGRLQQILGNMVNSVTDMTVGVNGIACDANAMLLAGKTDPTPDIVADLTKTNTTIAKMKQAIHDMKSNVEKFQKRAESDQVQDMINYAIALMVSLPFIIYILHTCLGVACTACRSVMPEGKVKKMSKNCAWCHLNTGACWAGGPGLILALVIFVALFVVSIALADFCYVGPGPVMLAAARDNNETSALTYYLECAGENPMAADVDAMAAAVSNLTDATASLTSLPTCDGPETQAGTLQFLMVNAGPPDHPTGGYPACTLGPVCLNVPAADTAVSTGVTDLLAAVDDIKADVLNCTKFQPIIETAFHDGVCTEAVAGLYYIWQVVVAAGVFTYIGIWLVPFATAAFKQEGGGVVGVADTDPEKGIFGDQSEYDETGKLMEAAAVADQPGADEPVL
jgi:hypothetical protein